MRLSLAAFVSPSSDDWLVLAGLGVDDWIQRPFELELDLLLGVPTLVLNGELRAPLTRIR